MAKFRAEVEETRVFPSLGITVNNGDIVDLPAETNVAGLVPIKEQKNEKPVATPVAEKESE